MRKSFPASHDRPAQPDLAPKIAILLRLLQVANAPRPDELDRLRSEIRDLERALARARTQQQITETVHDALASRILEKETALRTEWRELIANPSVERVDVTDRTVIVELRADSYAEPLCLHLQADGLVRLTDRDGRQMDLDPDLCALLARHLANGQITMLLDRLLDLPRSEVFTHHPVSLGASSMEDGFVSILL